MPNPNPNNGRFAVNDAIALQAFLSSKEGLRSLDELMARRPALITTQGPTIEGVAIHAGVVHGYELALQTLLLMSQERPDVHDLATNKQMSMDKDEKE